MKDDILEVFYTKLEALYRKGDEATAQQLIAEEFPKMSEEVQGEILARMYFKGLDEQNRQAETVARIQEKGLEVLDALDAMEAVLKSRRK